MNIINILNKELKKYKINELTTSILGAKCPFINSYNTIGVYPYLNESYSQYEELIINKKYVFDILNQVEYIFYKNFPLKDNPFLIVYNCYDNDIKSLNKLEKTLNNIKIKDSINKCLFENKEKIEFTQYLYLCNPSKYSYRELFKEIILSDIGGEYDFTCNIFILNLKQGILFNLFDDRGFYIAKVKQKTF